MTAIIAEKALDLGRLVGQSDEYQALRRANDRLMGEQPLREALERLHQLQVVVAEQLEKGEDVKPEQQSEIETLTGSLQAHPAYQGVVVAQANFDKLMFRINEKILEGMKKGADSKIITLS
jgi:cell fate (sporulation/competence/biofilm development) regulator YlbF (YheA/YmcA/DUF963 family)